MYDTLEVDVDAFRAAQSSGAYVIDVREPDEFAAGHVPGARLVPLNSLAGTFADFPADRPLYLVCASGGRSLQATLALRRAGAEAFSLRGGTRAWIAAGLPVDVEVSAR
jgi:rhodanese-related sulfurtransferase